MIMRNVIFYPTYDYALQMRKRAAKNAAPHSFGVLHTTPQAYFKEAWDVWGDERKLVDGVERKLIMQSLLLQQEVLGSTSGTIEALASFIDDYAGLPHLLSESKKIAQDFPIRPSNATNIDSAVCQVILQYFKALEDKHLIELGDAITYLSMVVPQVHYSFVAQPTLTWSMQAFFKERNALPEYISKPLLLEDTQSKNHKEIPPLTFLKPTGVDAQPLQLQVMFARIIQAWRDKGSLTPLRIGLISPDIQALYVRLAPSLLGDSGAKNERHVVTLQTRIPFTHTEFGKALAAIWSLLLQEPLWKEAASAFARSPYAELCVGSSVTSEELSVKTALPSRSTIARTINTNLRSHQGMSPVDAWVQLQQHFTTPNHFESLITDFDASTILPYFTNLATSIFAGDEVARRRELGAISALRDIYEKAQQYLTDPYAVRYLLESVRIPVSYTQEGGVDVDEFAGTAALFEVVCMDKQALQSLAPESFDVLVVADATSDDFSIVDKPGALENLRVMMKLPEKQKRLEQAYTMIASLRDAAREELVFSIPQKNAQAEEAYPAFFCSELAKHASQIREEIRGEDDLVATLTVGDMQPDAQQNVNEEYETWANHSSHALQKFALIDMIPTVQEQGKRIPLLSPTDLERYHDCPYKWFISKCIRPESPDAGFDGLAAGNFVHAVFCSFYTKLHEAEFDRVTRGNIDDAHRLLQITIDECMADQRQKKQGYIPMDKNEEGIYERLVAALHDNLVYQAQCFSGFAPSELEYSIEQGDGVDFAHARLRGRVDRVDTNEQGDYVVIDYKGSITDKESGTKAETRDEVELPPYVQALIYAQGLKKLHKTKPYGAFYLNYKAKDIKGLLAGAYNPAQLDLSEFTRKKSEVALAFDVYLDQIEELCIPLVEALVSGNIAPHPQSSKSCTWCPVWGCPNRL